MNAGDLALRLLMKGELDPRLGPKFVATSDWGKINNGFRCGEYNTAFLEKFMNKPFMVDR